MEKKESETMAFFTNKKGYGETTYDRMTDIRSDRCFCLKSEIEKQPNWDELKEIEKTRREILRRVSSLHYLQFTRTLHINFPFLQ